MNFNTTNMTFRQLMANGLSYRVPQFQRDYSWDVDHWDDLWLDIVGLFGDEPEPAHYMGYLVLQSADSRSFDIIDGRQRMTTLSLLMLASVSHLTELAVPDLPDDPQLRRAQQLRSNYIGYLDNEQQREASTYRLGNMTLLDSSTNQQLGNIGFTERQRAYLESEFSITRKLGEEFDTWTVDKIRVRQGWMAKQASSIWQVNF